MTAGWAQVGLLNAAVATVLALAVAALARFVRRPAIVHALFRAIASTELLEALPVGGVQRHLGVQIETLERLPDLLNRLVAGGHRVRVQYITGHWLDVDDSFDLAKARNFL